MTWRDVRLQLDLPDGWRRRDDQDHLTFQAPSGLMLRVTPLHVPPEPGGPSGERPLLDWAMARSQARLGAVVNPQVGPCRFGLCATFTVPREHDDRARFWVLAGPRHVLVVSAQGDGGEADRAQARDCVASMHLVAATAFPN